MIAKRYETRIDCDGLVAIEKVWSKRIPDLPADTQFRDPTVVCHLCKILRMHDYSEEHVFLLIFDVKMRFKSFIEIGIGGNTTSIVDRRGVAQKLLLLNAGAFIVVHNHTSGDPTPSNEDQKVFETISKVGELIDICLKDFIILGGDEAYWSFKAHEWPM